MDNSDPNSAPLPGHDLSSTPNLFFSVRFNLTRFSVSNPQNFGCGSVVPPSSPLAGANQIVVIMQNPIVDLYGSNGHQARG